MLVGLTRQVPARKSANRAPPKGAFGVVDWLNFFLAGRQSGVGPFLAIYLAASGWNEQTIGIA